MRNPPDPRLEKWRSDGKTPQEIYSLCQEFAKADRRDTNVVRQL